jgi:hypothetical protein
VSTTPPIRPDLVATPVDEEGTRSYDVTQPGSTEPLRMYEFEWLIAQRMDGAVTFDELAAWAREQVGVEVDAPSLQVFAERLAGYGFFDHANENADADATAKRAAVAASPWAAAPAPSTAEATAQSAKADPSRLAALAQTLHKAPELSTNVDEMKAFFRQAPLAEDDGAARLQRRGATISSSVLSAIGITAVTAALPLLVYFTFMREAPPAHVHVTVARPQDVTELYDGESPAKRGAPKSIAFPVAGTISQIVPAGTQATPRMTLATLAERETAENELTHLNHRQEHYEKALADAKASGNKARIAAAGKKVAEKKKFIADLQARLPQLQVQAPEAGTVAEGSAQVGAAVQAGQSVLQLVDPSLHALFTVPAFDASSMGDGASVKLQAPGGRQLTAHVAEVHGDQVSVDIDPATGLKEGEPVRLVRASFVGQVKLPASAVVRRGGFNTAFVLQDGEVHAHTVNVYDRVGDEVRITRGLAAGDEVVVDPSSTMQDGDRAELQQ